MWNTWQRGEKPRSFSVEPIHSTDAADQAAAVLKEDAFAEKRDNELTTLEGTLQDRKQKRKLLHVGCGPQREVKKYPRYFQSTEWLEVRLDINEACNPDIVTSITSMAPVEDGSVSAIFSSHNLEHLHPHEVPVALQEFHRTLDGDGFVLITLPDLQSVAELVAQDKLEDTAYMSPAGPIAPIDILYGHRASISEGNLYMAHRTGFTTKTLSAALPALRE
jgi:SAM-dependent methyltransferase